MGRKTLTNSETTRPTVPVAADIKRKLVQWIQANHSPQQQLVVEQILRWFLEQPDSVKTAILGWTDEDMRAAYAKVLRELAAKVEGKPETPPDDPPGEVSQEGYEKLREAAAIENMTISQYIDHVTDQKLSGDAIVEVGPGGLDELLAPESETERERRHAFAAAGRGRKKSR